MSEAEKGFSKRERQIMECVYRLGEATVSDIQATISNPPTINAVRTMVQILEEKGHLTRTKRGREFVYHPVQEADSAGRAALSRVISTFFKGSIEEALAAHFSSGAENLDPAALLRIEKMIKEARKREEQE